MDSADTMRKRRRERLLREFYRNALAIALLQQCLLAHPSFRTPPDRSDPESQLPAHLLG